MKKILLVALLAGSPFVANIAAASERMTKEYCTSGQSGQEVSACLKELRNSRAEKFPQYTERNYKENELSRCEGVPDKALCEARVMRGTTSGEVKGGGTITELTVHSDKMHPMPHDMHQDMPRDMPKDKFFKYDPSK